MAGTSYFYTPSSPYTVFDLVRDTAAKEFDWEIPEITTADWTLVNIAPYRPPVIQSLGIGSEPPAVPDIPFGSVDAIYRAPDGTVSRPNVGTAPSLDAQEPSITIGTSPGDLVATKPGDAPTVDDVTIPDLPLDLDDIPSVPPINDVVIPPFEGIETYEFTALPPDTTIVVPENTFVFDETPYTSDMLDQVTVKISRMLDGGTGLPEAVWQQIFERGAELEEVNASQLVETTIAEFASKGWSAPGGVLDMRIREARQKIQNARNTLARDITVKRAEMELENLKYALAQGLALETMLVTLHNSYYERRLKAAEVDMQLKIHLVNAQVAILNAELGVYQTTASVYKTLIEAEMTKVEVYRVELEGVKLGVEVDQLKIQAYAAQVNALSIIVDLHNSQLEGIKTAVEVDKLRMDAYRTEVGAYSEYVKSWGIEWDGYKTGIDAQKSKVDVYVAQVQAFASETDAYKANVQAEAVRVDADVKALGYNISRMQADATRYSAEVQYQIGRAAATADTYKTQMQGYQAKSSYVSTQAQAYQAEMMAHIENAKAVADVNTEGARIAASQNDAIGRANVAAQETIARITAQIQASVLGQFSSSAGVSSSSGYSYSETKDVTDT